MISYGQYLRGIIQTMMLLFVRMNWPICVTMNVLSACKETTFYAVMGKITGAAIIGKNVIMRMMGVLMLNSDESQQYLYLLVHD